jgi:hypothetical protein
MACLTVGGLHHHGGDVTRRCAPVILDFYVSGPRLDGF